MHRHGFRLPRGLARRAATARRAAAGLALALAAAAAQAQSTVAPGPDIPMAAQPVATDTWFVQGESALGSAANRNFISNAGFVITPQGVLVVDALGSPPLAQRLVDLIRERTSAPIRYVVVTHCHADHLYGLQVFQSIGARIVAHAGCRDYLASDTARLRLQASRQELFPWVDENTRLVQADEWLNGDEERELRLGDRRFILRHAGPAHTAEDLVVHDTATGVTFVGDIVFRGRIPFVGQADSRRWVQALDRLLALRPRVMVAGHGPLSFDAAADLAMTRDYLSYLRQTMGEAARNLEPFDEAYARVDWSRFAAMPLFAAANRMNAYNTYLLMEHEAP